MPQSATANLQVAGTPSAKPRRLNQYQIVGGLFRPVRPDRRLGRADGAIVLCLLFLCVFQVATVQRVESYGADSSVYMGLAHNILATGRYEFNFKPHTLYPPGFPVLLALITIMTGQASYDVFVRLMPVFSTLALVVWYFVLRRDSGRAVAAASCLLVATSAPLFQLVTQAVLSDAPFFLMSGLALLCLMRLDRQEARGAARLLVLTCFCLATAATVLVRSAGIALCAALIGWLITEAWRRRSGRPVPWHAVAFTVLVGFTAFICWIGWAKRSERLDYQGQHAGSYASVFVARDPHWPELGVATAGQLAVRCTSNAPAQASHIAAMLTRAGHLMPTWCSPPAAIILLLLLCGLVSSVVDRERMLLAWYFLAYFTVYLLWPFDEGERFMLPVSPLAFVVVWRGMVAVAHLMRTRPTTALGAVSMFGAVFAAGTVTAARLPGLQARVAVAFWPLLAAVALCLIFLVRLAGETRATAALNSALVSVALRRIQQVAVGALIAVGVFQQAATARTNLAPNASLFRHHSSADCASWLRAAGTGVVMAQQSEIVHRLSGLRVVGFPVTSSPRLIVATMMRENVRHLVVCDPVPYEYFHPTEEERWRRVERTYPLMFQLVHKGPGYRVFEVRGLNFSANATPPAWFNAASRVDRPAPHLAN
ncbi:MAG: ArnT family glycosyltransferase [Bryobacteraceae bacterium]